MRFLISAALAATAPPPHAKEVASFGIITDVHYADADTSGTRYYRDSLPKVRASIADLASRSTDFLIELGDFKDTDVGSGCGKGKATPACINLTLSFLATIEAEMAKFPGARFHLLGNHDVDVLNQSAVLNATTNSPVTDPGGPGYYSFDFPFAPEPVGNDTDGCLVRDGLDVWIVHADGTRNWLSTPPAGACDAARPIADASAYPKRHGGKGAYNLDADQSAAAFAQRCNGCVCDGAGLPAALPSPAPGTAPLRFIALNGDYTADDVPWADLDGGAVPGESWDDAHVPTPQLWNVSPSSSSKHIQAPSGSLSSFTTGSMAGRVAPLGPASAPPPCPIAPGWTSARSRMRRSQTPHDSLNLPMALSMALKNAPVANAP